MWFCALQTVMLWAAQIGFDIPSQPLPTALQFFIRQAGARVIFNRDELQGLVAPAVKGDLDPAAALAQLLANSGFEAKEVGPRHYAIKKKDAPNTGSLKGALLNEGRRPLRDVTVTIRETDQTVVTDEQGGFVLPNVSAGSYVLVINAVGYQTLHIVDARVRAGHQTILSPEVLRKAPSGVTQLDPFVIRADQVTELEKYEVSEMRAKPFTPGNMDLTRTMNDVQPYYIFDAQTIGLSGATSVEEFLKQRLPMDASVQTNSQSENNTQGATSSINLRGLGADKTLILINGRRQAPVATASFTTATSFASNVALGQPDLNAIPLGSIERIEILPSSASAIYGASAIGGVINVILKRNYVGGEILMTYATPWDTSAPTRTASLNYSFGLWGGKTRIRLNASWGDSQPLLVRDRRQLIDRGLARILTNAPASFYSSSWTGVLPNVRANNVDATTLTLKDGTVLPSAVTYVPGGTSVATPTAALYGGLAANAGKWSLELPDTTQSPSGLRRPFGAAPVNRAAAVMIDQKLTSTLDASLDVSHRENNSTAVFNPVGSQIVVSSVAPTNPFTSSVLVAVPNAPDVPLVAKSAADSVTLGVRQKLPRDWILEGDYSWSQTRMRSRFYSADTTTLANDINSGALNVFVDAIANPIDFSRYYLPSESLMRSRVSDAAVRAAGPIWALPWGTPQVAVGLERYVTRLVENRLGITFPLMPAYNTTVDYFPRDQTSENGHAELLVPLVRPDALRWVRALELQLVGRHEEYKIDVGTPYVRRIPGLKITTYGSPTLNGRQFFSHTKFRSNDGTAGLKYAPVRSVTLRASVGTAFLPPTSDQLLKNPVPSTTRTNVTDPRNGNGLTPVYTIGGGNPEVKPQHSRSLNAGVIWQPAGSLLKGLRLDAEYYRIKQFDAIGTLTAQQVVDMESTFHGRVIRDSSGAITQVDISALNLFLRDTEGIDLSADYTRRTGWGNLSLFVVHSTIIRLETQYSLSAPRYDAVDFPAESGAIKHKTNGGMVWERHGWSVGWNVYHIGSYRQYGAPGGPSATQRAASALEPLNTYTAPQGGTRIASQTYHDLLVGYAFDNQPANRGGFPALLSGLSLQMGVKNVFNRVPPYDYFYAYYTSPLGDVRLRSIWFSVKKTF